MYRIPYGVGHLFIVPVISQANTKLFKTGMTIAAGDAKLRNRSQAFTNLAAEYIAFTSGSVAPAVGETLTGATSGTTAKVVGWFLTSGTWTGGDAAGGLFLESVSAALQAENLNGALAGANCMTIGGDSTVALMADAGQGNVAVPLTSVGAQTDYGQIALIDAADAEWCASEIDFETVDHPLAGDPLGCILSDAVGSATGQSTTNIRLSGAPTTAPKVGMFFRVIDPTNATVNHMTGRVKTYTAGATYDVVPYETLPAALTAYATVKFYEDNHVAARVVATEDIDLSATQKASVTAAVPNAAAILAAIEAGEIGADLDEIITTLGAAGAGLTALGDTRLAELGATNIPADIDAIITTLGVAGAGLTAVDLTTLTKARLLASGTVTRIDAREGTGGTITVAAGAHTTTSCLASDASSGVRTKGRVGVVVSGGIAKRAIRFSGDIGALGAFGYTDLYGNAVPAALAQNDVIQW